MYPEGVHSLVHDFLGRSDSNLGHKHKMVKVNSFIGENKYE